MSQAWTDVPNPYVAGCITTRDNVTYVIAVSVCNMERREMACEYWKDSRVTSELARRALPGMKLRRLKSELRRFVQVDAASYTAW